MIFSTRSIGIWGGNFEIFESVDPRLGAKSQARRPYRGSAVTSRRGWPGPGSPRVWSRTRSRTWPRSARTVCTCGTGDSRACAEDWTLSECRWSSLSSIRSCSRSCNCSRCPAGVARSLDSPPGGRSCSIWTPDPGWCATLKVIVRFRLLVKVDRATCIFLYSNPVMVMWLWWCNWKGEEDLIDSFVIWLFESNNESLFGIEEEDWMNEDLRACHKILD